MNSYLQNPVYERVITENLFLLKIPLEEAHRWVPKPFSVLEIGPGTAVLGIGLQKIADTSFCSSRDVDKIYIVYGIHARYDTGTASPRFAFYVHRMYASDSIFLDHIERINHSPVYRGKGLRFAYDPEAISLSAQDDDGMILTLRSTHPNPVFRKYTVWNHAAVMRNGIPYLQATEWKGEAFEHQNSPEVGEVFQHPLFAGLPVRGLGSQAYHQLVMRPNGEATMALFQPVCQRGGTVRQ
jgi:hypothetical protein